MKNWNVIFQCWSTLIQWQFCWCINIESMLRSGALCFLKSTGQFADRKIQPFIVLCEFMVLFSNSWWWVCLLERICYFVVTYCFMKAFELKQFLVSGWLQSYLAHRLCGGNTACASRLWYKYRHTMWPDVKKPTITHSALKPRWLMGKWHAHHVHTPTKSRK